MFEMAVNSLSLEGEVRTTLETLRSMPAQLGELIERHRLETIQIGLDQSLSLSGKTQKQNDVAKRFIAKVDQMEESAKAYKADIQRYIDKALGKPQGDPAQELLYEFRMAQAWRRIERVLDSAKDRSTLVRQVVDLVNEYAKNDDVLAVQAMDAELDAYFKARNMTPPVEVAKNIEAVLVAHASPEERRAIALRDEVSIGYPRLSAAFAMTKSSIQSNSPAVALPGWDETEKILINLPAEPATPSWV
jgi:hypothetical protein